MRRSLLLLALASGASALIYEVVWMRWFRLLFGNTAHASSATLCAFFLGLALGAALFGRLATRARRPLLLYGGLELGVVATALLVPLAIELYDPIYTALYSRMAEGRLGFVAIKFALALAAMLPSSILLGGTLPALATAYVGEGGSLGRDGGSLYAANLLGGALGAAAGGLVLPEWIGIAASYGVGLLGSGAVGCAALLIARSEAQRPAAIDGAVAQQARAPLAALVVAGASGFGVLAFQVLLIQALAQLFVHTAYSFGIVLVVVLLSLTAGSAFVAASEGRWRVAPLLTGALLAEAVVLLALPWLATATRDGLVVASVLLSVLSSPLAGTAIAASAFGVPALLFASVVFPLTFRLASGGPPGRRLGGLLAANTVGGIAGSLAASFVLLEIVGLWRSFALLGLAYGGVALLVAEGGRQRAAALATLLALLVLAFATPASPWRLSVVIEVEGQRRLAVSESAHGIVSVFERTGGHRLMRVDNQYVFGDTSESVLYERTGHLPLLLHPDPRRVLFVGSATGGLAAAAVLHPVQHIELVEIMPQVQPLAAEFFAFSNRDVHHDPRTRGVIEDGRNHLRATGERYDVVVEDLFVPQRPSSSAMYSREHYQEVRRRLTERGIFCQWLALYQLSKRELAVIVRTFTDEFPDGSVWRPYFRWGLPIVGLIASPGGLPSVEMVERRARELAGYGIDDPWLTDPLGVWTFYLGPVSALAELLAGAPANLDDHPIFEFISARTTLRQRRRLRDYGWPRLTQKLVALDPDADPAFPGHPKAGPRGGEALAQANRAAAAGDLQRLPNIWPRIRENLPASLLEHEDPSVSAVWPPARRPRDPRRE